MPSFINTNLASVNAQRNLNQSQGAQTTALQRLSSGLRINSAKDDAAGMSISSRMSSQINGTTQAARNANDGISLAQTAEGDLNQISTNLQRMRDLSVQSANATNSASDRAALNNEVQALSQEIDRVAANSSFNGVKLLDGSFTAQNFQVGANATANDSIQLAITSARTTQLGGVGATTAATRTGAATTAAIVAGDVTLNGFQVGASVVGALPGQSAASAAQIAVAINAISGSSGVTATANTTTIAGAAPATGALTAANSLSVNGISIGAIAAGVTAAGQGANVAAAFNSVSSQSGVTALADATTGVVTLSAIEGRDITLLALGTTTVAQALAATGLVTGDTVTPAAAVTTHGTITLNSTNAAGIVQGGATAASAGLTAAGLVTAATTTSNVSAISAINISTAAGATSALTAIDGAIATVNASRSALGAYQNRFASVVSTLQTTTENLTASRSRIQDTDFAAETASLSRAQILQQAGTAMLAQANQLPSQVMTLLR